MRKKKVLISQPMGDLPLEKVKENRANLVKALEDMNYTILDNLFTDEPDSEVVNTQIYYLSKAVRLICEADLVVFIGEWMCSRGCSVEYDICVKYGIRFIDLSTYLQTHSEFDNPEYIKFLLNNKS